MEVYTVTADSYEEAVSKARAMYGEAIRVQSRRDFTTRGGLFSKRHSRCEIVCYIPAVRKKQKKSDSSDIREFEREAMTPDPSSLSAAQRLDTDIYRGISEVKRRASS